jgi:hypothetical protein
VSALARAARTCSVLEAWINKPATDEEAANTPQTTNSTNN